jgi:hypothetical protein
MNPATLERFYPAVYVGPLLNHGLGFFGTKTDITLCSPHGSQSGKYAIEKSGHCVYLLATPPPETLLTNDERFEAML